MTRDLEIALIGLLDTESSVVIYFERKGKKSNPASTTTKDQQLQHQVKAISSQVQMDKDCTAMTSTCLPGTVGQEIRTLRRLC